MLFFVLVFVKWNKKKATYYGNKTQECAGNMTKWLQQAFGGVKEIKILRREDFFADNYDFYCELTNKMNQKFAFLNSIPHLVLECFCTAVILLIIVIRVMNGENVAIFVPKMAVFAMALFRLFPRISRINISVNTIIFNLPYMNSVYDDMKKCDEHKNSRIERRNKGSLEKELTFNNNIILENIHFSYPNSEVQVLNGINLTINKGDAIGLVGPSGSGKSTLADVLLGLLEGIEGTVLCDGKDIRNHIEEWSEKLGYIPQSIFLSDDTIRNNIAFGLEESKIDDTRVWN